MRKKSLAISIIILVLALLVGGYFFYDYKEKHSPSDERISIAQYYDNPTADKVFLYRYHKPMEFNGILKNKEVYLPLAWVQEYVNDTFYLDSANHNILYTEADGTTVLPLGALEYFYGEPYIALSEVKSRSNLLSRDFIGGDVNRVYLTDDTESYVTAKVKTDAVIRIDKSIKAPGIADLAAGATVDILEEPQAEMNDEEPESLLGKKEKKLKEDDVPWVYVMSEDGLIGYIQESVLDNYVQACVISDYTEPKYSHILMDEPVLLAWHQVTNMASNNYLKDLLKNTSGINVISPTWFSLSDNEGNFDSLASHDYVAYAHDRGMKVWALVDNFSSSVSSLTILSNTRTRKTLIENLIAASLEYQVDGINIDFEMLPMEASEPFAQFIRELSVECRHNNLVLSIDNPAAASFNLYYRRDVQARYADYVINMGYDEHYSGGEAGSVASLPFVEDSMDLTLMQVPSEQFINGIPFYTRVWQIRGDETTSIAQGLGVAKDWVRENQVELSWNDELGQYYGEIRRDEMLSSIWMEENTSLALKIEAAKKRNLAGIACWKLGLEDAQAWEVVKY